MKKVIYTLLFLIATTASYATTYYWIGGLTPSVNYSNNANWTTNPVTRTPVAATGTLVITSTDVLVFDGTNLGGTSVVTGPATVLASGADTFGQLKFLNNANITFGRTTTGTTKFTLFGDGTSAPDLIVDATSTLTLGGTISGANVGIILDTVNQNATGSISGNLYMSPLSSNTGPHTASYITAGAGELVFNSGSACYSSDSTTVSCFNGSTANSVVFKSGASLYYYTGRSPVGKSSTLPFVVFESGSNFYIRGSNVSYVDGTTAYASSSWTSGKTFANVFIQNGATYTADGTVNKIEDFTIDAGCTFFTHLSGQTPVTGNLVVNGALTAPAAGTTNILVLGGNSPQTVSGTGTISVLSFTVCDNSNVALAKNIVTTGTTVNIVGKLDFGATSVISGTASFTSRVAGTAAAATGNTVTGSYQITGASAGLSGLTGLTISGAGIQANTNVIGFGTGYINLSKPATATATGTALTFASGAATLATANPNGFDSTNGSVTVVGIKSYNSGTNYVINGATTYPFGISSTASAAGIGVGNITLNAAATTNTKIKVAGMLTLNAGKLTIRSSDTVRVLASGDIVGSPFSSTKYIVTDVNGSNSGALRVDSFTVVKLLPIGTAANYLPVTITPSTGYAGFTASVFEGVTADGTLGGTAFTASQKANVVDAVWNVNRVVGSGNTDVTVGWADALEGSNFASLSDAQIGVSRYNSSNWTVANAIAASNTTNTATSTNGSFGPFGVGKSGDILPVKLVNLNASINNNSVAISFDALNETDIEKYAVERSSNGANYSVVGNLPAYNIGGERTYHFTDANVATGTYLYRIAIVDKNGKTSYSQLLKVAISTKLNVSVYPNPANNEIAVSGIVKGSTLQILDISGRIISQQIVNNEAQTINISKLSKGVFVIKTIQPNGVVSNTSFIKD